MIKVIKRDGRTKAFDKRFIQVAVSRAECDVREEVSDLGLRIAQLVEESLIKDSIDEIGIEDIQDLVLKFLNKEDKDVAKVYKEFRDERTFQREESAELINSIKGLVDHSNIDVITENSNKQSTIASTQRDLISGEVSKYISKKSLIPRHIVEANNEGIIHLHDLDYYLQPITNCQLVPLDDMFKNGTVINKKMIETPKSFQTACTVATQISAQVSSFTYGGQTISLSHLAPYVRVSENKIKKEVLAESEKYGISYTDEQVEGIVKDRLKKEIKAGVQTINYQISTLNSTNGQSPFVSVCMYISENPEYEEETAMIIEEFLKQRIQGMKNEYGVVSTQTFPKLLFFLDENNMYPESKYYYLKQLAVKATAKRMNPDYISVKKMKEVYGYAYACMGCRSFLAPYINEKGEVQFYGRGNMGVCTLNLVDIALSSKGDVEKFWEIFNDRMDNIVKPSCMLRYDKLEGVKASVAPILWQHGVFSRLNPDDYIQPVVKEKFSVSIGYAGLYETVKYMTGKGQTEKEGFEFAKQVMTFLSDKAEQYKEETGLGFSIYGSPIESTTEWFSRKLKERFGEIKDITDKGWITNSYHIDIREHIDAFTKLEIEGELQKLSLGGNVSYVEVYNMEKNLPALEEVINFMYENNIYAEINSESDVCGKCKYTGVMDNDEETLNWVCPNCGNDDQQTLSVIRRSCGYLGETTWITGRKLDILNRVKHL